MLSFMLQIWIHDKFKIRGIEQQRRTFRRGWAYLGGGDGDDEIVLRSMSDGLRRACANAQQRPGMWRNKVQNYTVPSATEALEHVACTSTANSSTPLSPTARTTTARPQDLPTLQNLVSCCRHCLVCYRSADPRRPESKWVACTLPARAFRPLPSPTAALPPLGSRLRPRTSSSTSPSLLARVLRPPRLVLPSVTRTVSPKSAL